MKPRIRHIVQPRDQHLLEGYAEQILLNGFTVVQHVAAAGQDGEVILYPEAGHAFMNDSRPAMYREAAAQDAWPKLVAFLREKLA